MQILKYIKGNLLGLFLLGFLSLFAKDNFALGNATEKPENSYFNQCFQQMGDLLCNTLEESGIAADHLENILIKNKAFYDKGNTDYSQLNKTLISAGAPTFDFGFYDINGQAISTCSGNFYDSGGALGDYSNDENYTATFQSSDGNPISFDFGSTMDIDNSGNPCTEDYLIIYDGLTTASPHIVTICSDYNNMGIITSTNPDNALTFQFVSNDVDVASGWAATISCAPPSPNPCDALATSNQDSDGDNVADFCDIDDDNDGILNADESICTNANWGTAPWLWTGGTFNNTLTDVVGNVDLTIDVSTTAAGSWEFESVSNDRVGGNNTYFGGVPDLGVGFDPDPGQGTSLVTIVITFSEPVHDASFLITDIDGSSGFGIVRVDQVTITTDEGNPILEQVNTTANELNILGNVAKPFDPRLGSNNDDVGSIKVTLPDGTTTITILYEEISGNADPFPRGIGILGELQFCANDDTDNDGTPNYLDLDADNDGCPDAIEGGSAFTLANIQNDTLIGGVDANGIPLLASSSGQAIGDSQDVGVQDADCCDAVAGTFATSTLIIEETTGPTVTHNANHEATNTQEYLLTNQYGFIMQIATSPSFSTLPQDEYSIYAINYETGGVDNLAQLIAVSALTGSCFDLEGPVVVTVTPEQACATFNSVEQKSN